MTLHTTVYKHQDYRDVLRDEVKARKGVGTTYHSLAQAVKVQDPYVSKVMKRAAHFNGDQLYLACQYLEATAADARYLELLHDYQTSGIASRRAALLEKINEEQAQHLDTAAHLTAPRAQPDSAFSQYYLDPFLQLAHVGLSIPRYQASLATLAADLCVPTHRVQAAVERLILLGIVESRGQGRFRSTGMSLHLERESPLYPVWEAQLRSLSQARRQCLPKELSYGFSVVFSADEPTRKEILTQLLALVQSLEPVVQQAPEEDVYQLGLDLFSWTRAKV